jgi:hypothetical protein
VIWVVFDAESMQLGPFYWFGARPGEPIPDPGSRIGRHTRGRKAERPSIRVLNRSRFKKLDSMDEVVSALFGDL